MLGAMLGPSSGSIVTDVDIASARERMLPPLRAHNFGFVFQEFNLLSTLDALENVELAANLAAVHGQPDRRRGSRRSSGFASPPREGARGDCAAGVAGTVVAWMSPRTLQVPA